MATLVNKETYKVMSYLKNQSLDVKGGYADDNTRVTAWGFTGGNNEQWIVGKTDGGYFSLTPRCIAKGGVRRVMDASKTAPGQVIVFTYSGADNQLWALEPVEASNYLSFIRCKAGGYLQFNGENKELSVSPRTGAKNQQWSFQEMSANICQDAAWYDSLTTPMAEEERIRIEMERVERERIERERIERERIERENLDKNKLEQERIERERIERERIERERLERERLEREKRENELKEMERRLAEKEAMLKRLEEDQRKKEELEWASREKAIADRERQIAIMELERREKAIKDREAWLLGRNKAQSELTIVMTIIRTSRDEAELKKAAADKARLDGELREYDRIEREMNMREKVLKEKTDSLEAEKRKKEAELKILESRDMHEAIRQREIWLTHYEFVVKSLRNIKITYVYQNAEPKSTSHTTHTSSVEVVGGERITRNVDVTETERVVKTVEYR